MKILYFHQHFSTPAGATGTRSYENAKRLVIAGHKVHMICGAFQAGVTGLEGPFKRGRRDGTVEGISITEFDLPYSNDQRFLVRFIVFLRYALRCMRISLTEEADLIVATSTPLTAAIPGLVGKVIRQRRFVFEVRDLWPELPVAMGVITNPVVIGLMTTLERWAYRFADRCIGLSPGIVEGIISNGGESDKVSMIPNGCDIEFFSQIEASEARLSPDGRCFTAVYSGTHGLANGLEAVLDCAEVLKKRGRNDIKILLVGNGMCKRALCEDATKRALSNVEFRDAVGKQELATLFSSVDLGLQILKDVPAFYYGTSPNKFFDYIAAGLPVLTNYPGWVAELIEDSECGYAVPPNDPNLFANAIEHAADNAELLFQKCKNARNLAMSKFDRKKLSLLFLNCIERAGA